MGGIVDVMPTGEGFLARHSLGHQPKIAAMAELRDTLTQHLARRRQVFDHLGRGDEIILAAKRHGIGRVKNVLHVHLKARFLEHYRERRPRAAAKIQPFCAWRQLFRQRRE